MWNWKKTAPKPMSSDISREKADWEELGSDVLEGIVGGVDSSGLSALPTVVYVNFNGAVAGFANSYLTLFLRPQEIEKSLD